VILSFFNYPEKVSKCAAPLTSQTEQRLAHGSRHAPRDEPEKAWARHAERDGY